MANLKIILREKIHKLGVESDIVSVKPGFARNFLIPQGKAFPVTQENLRHLKALKQKRAEREKAELTTARELANKIQALKLNLTLEMGQNDKAFGSITSTDLHKELAKSSIKIERQAILLDKPIKTTGLQEINIKLHSDVVATLKFEITAEVDKVAE